MAITICPKFWHLPDSLEWEILTVVVGGKETAGKYLKAVSGWKEYKKFKGSKSYEIKSGNGEDKYGFSALPGGYGYSYDNIGSSGIWWSTSECDSEGVYIWEIDSSGEYVSWIYGIKNFLHSVRCVQNQ